MAVLLDIIDGNNAVLTLAGWTFNRIAIVTGLTGSGHSMVYEAYEALGISIGAAHPATISWTHPAYLFQISPEAMPHSGNTVRLSLEYRQFARDVQYSIAASTFIEKSNNSIAKEGDDYVEKAEMLKYTFPSDYKYDERLRGQTLKQLPEFEYIIPKPSFTIARVETKTYLCDACGPGTPLTIPLLLYRITQWTGTTNENIWYGLPAESVLLEDIQADSPDNGISYNVKYTFTFWENRGKGWKGEYKFIDRETNLPPPDVYSQEVVPYAPGTESSVLRPVRVYPPSNFDLLQLI